MAYLGHLVSSKGVATDHKKIQKVAEWPAPQKVFEVRQFVGLALYYRRFVKDFASVAKPLHELTKMYARFNWTDECQEAFEQLKSRLTSAHPCSAIPSTVASCSSTRMPVTGELEQSSPKCKRVRREYSPMGAGDCQPLNKTTAPPDENFWQLLTSPLISGITC